MQVVDVDVDILALLFVPDCSIVWNIRGIYDTQYYLKIRYVLYIVQSVVFCGDDILFSCLTQS